MRRARAITSATAFVAAILLHSPAHGVEMVAAHAPPSRLRAEAAPHQPLTGQTAAMAAGATYVGSDTCTSCHGDVEGQLAHTPHGSAAFGKLAPHGCETCHGPGSK